VSFYAFIEKVVLVDRDTVARVTRVTFFLRFMGSNVLGLHNSL